MKAIVLGAAAGGGFPQWNCRCAVCALAWARDERVKPATQSSLAVSPDERSWLLLNVSPDIGAQLRATPALWPRGPRESPISAVALTNADIDHIGGLLTLRERQVFSIFAMKQVQAALTMNPMFTVLAAPVRMEVYSDVPFRALDGLQCELVAVPGKVALFLEGESPKLASDEGDTAAAFVSDGNKTLAYVPGCASLTDRLVDRLSEADAVLFDGTLFTDDEMIKAGVGEKTGRRMGHLPIAGEGGSLEISSKLPVARKIYVHINNTNPVWIDGSPERREVEAAGVEIAYDGMEIVL